MAALDFPNTPVVGDTYGSLGTLWRWDGTRWASTAGVAGARGTVGYAQITAPQGSIAATVVAIGGLSVSWTPDPARRYRTTAYGAFFSTVANDQASLIIRNTAGAQIQSANAQVPTTVGFAEWVTATIVETGLSGAQTRSVAAQRNSGTGTLTFHAGSANPAFILVEDVTYEAGSGGPLSTPWEPFTPAWAGVTVADGVQKFMKRYTGDHIELMGGLDFGVSTAVTGGVSFPIPDGRTAAAGIGLTTQPIGTAVYTNLTGPLLIGASRTSVLFRVTTTVAGVAGSYVTWAGLSPTVPIAWTSNDHIAIQASIPLEPV